MRLTDEQEEMLSGKKGEAERKAMEILVGLGNIYEAERLIPVESAHISGVSIRTAGEAGLEFIEDLVGLGAKAKVPTTINPAGMDLENWRELGAPEEMSKKQIRMIDAYRELGAKTVCSCSPYLLGNEPSYGDHIAWAESSAVVYANSVLGARTNREGAPSALASAITGLTPEYGLHLDGSRKGTVAIEPDPALFRDESTFSYSVLGYWIGERFPESVPVVKGLNPTPEQHKALGAGMATSGAIALYHIPGITPEAKKDPDLCEVEEEVEFGRREHDEVVEKLDQVGDAELVFLGCPHVSEKELEKMLKDAEGSEKEVWICMGRDLSKNSKVQEMIGDGKPDNVKIVCDTCMVVAPLSDMGFSSIGVNSAKAAHYAPSLAGVKVHFAPEEDLVK